MPRLSFALLLLAIGAASAPAVQPPDLATIFSWYEGELLARTQSGTPEEKGLAVRLLATIASSHYETARDRLLEDPSKPVRTGVLWAMADRHDSSPQAQGLITRSLVDADADVVGAAVAALHAGTLKVDFSRLWNPEAATFIWTNHIATNGVDLTHVTGVARARPWQDRAFKALPWRARQAILGRAGTREAMALLASASAPPPGENPMSPAMPEPSDLPYLRELLAGDSPELRRYASQGLVDVGDEAHIEQIRTCIAVKLGGETGHCPVASIAELSTRPLLSKLDERSLELLLKEGSQSFMAVSGELRQRGVLLTYDELSKELAARPPPRSNAPFPDLTTEEREAVTYRMLVWRTLIQALVREQRFGELPRRLEACLKAGNLSDLRELYSEIAASPRFLAALPADVAHQCVPMLKSYFTSKVPDDSRLVTSARLEDAGPALEILGLIARGADADSLWTAWRAKEKPFQAQSFLIPIRSGFDRRTQDLREALAAAGATWNSGGLVLGSSGSAERCPGSWDPFRLPRAITPTLVSLHRELSRRLEQRYPDRNDAALATDFLALRGWSSEGLRDGPRAFEAMLDANERVRNMAGLAIREVPLREIRFPSDWSGPRKEELLVQLRRRYDLGFVSTDITNGPSMSAEDRRWLQEILDVMKRERLKGLIDRTTMIGDVISCGFGPAPTTQLVGLPRGSFVGALDHIDEIRALLTTDDTTNRHEAAWAFWNWDRDPKALQVFLDDTKATDGMVRAKAFRVLLAARHEPSAVAFPPLLNEREPALRQIGLWGVRVFRLPAAIPAVQNLVVDDNAAVNETALEVLTDLRAPGTRDLLLGLLRGTNDRLAWKASSLLPRFHSRDDVDAYLARLEAARKPQEAWALLDVIASVTFYPVPDRWTPQRSATPPAVPADMTKELKEWWARFEDKPRIEWLRDGMDRRASLDVVKDPRGRDPATERVLSVMGQVLPAAGRAGWWSSHRADDAWNLVHTAGLPLDRSLELQFEVAPDKARKLLFGAFSQTALAGMAASTYHPKLVEYAGIDLGNPSYARCDLRQQILDAWSAWAKREGWLE